MEFWFSEFHTPDVKHSIRVNKQLYSKQSDYQRIDIFETPEFGRVLTLDGNVMLTERDEFIYDEMIVHVPMAVHKEAKDILVIGAGDGGVVRELTRYDRVERIDLVEMDPQVVEACRADLPGKFDLFQQTRELRLVRHVAVRRQRGALQIALLQLPLDLHNVFR